MSVISAQNCLSFAFNATFCVIEVSFCTIRMGVSPYILMPDLSLRNDQNSAGHPVDPIITEPFISTHGPTETNLLFFVLHSCRRINQRNRYVKNKNAIYMRTCTNANHNSNEFFYNTDCVIDLIGVRMMNAGMAGGCEVHLLTVPPAA